MRDDFPKPRLVTNQVEQTDALEELLRQFETGEVEHAVLRVYRKDGTWEDVALGYRTDEERAAAIEQFRASMARHAN